MSDEDDFMQDSDAEQYDFEYDTDEDENTADVDVENKYYNAKQIKVANPQEAIEEFLGLPALEEEKGDWHAVEHYRELLTYIKSAVTRNYSEKSINNILDFIERMSDDRAALTCMEQFYSLTLQSFQSTNNERLWLKTNIKMAKLWLDRKEYQSLGKKLRQLHEACLKDDGTDDPSKGTYALEIYALEIQMYADMKNNKRLKALYQKALSVKSAVPHPKIMGIIQECGGRMHMSEENWKEAHSAFFESFKSYDEAGSLQRIQVLKYLVLAVMLMKSDINPFESQETKPYKNDPRIAAMTDLVDAYQRDDISKYESVLQKNRDIMADPFISENIDEVTRNMRMKGVLKLIAPYTRFTLDFVAKQLKIAVPEVQEILGYLILDKKIDGKIDQQAGTVEIESQSDIERLEAMAEWSRSVRTLWVTVFSESEGFKDDELAGVQGGGLNRRLISESLDQASKRDGPSMGFLAWNSSENSGESMSI
ncbi:MAG: hypothetical protein M1814_006140 [Vezdaea aestivalis]|nr:MAG: hypothetical protein M1814_006140 [Vezdaea aestivalis]